MKWKLLKWGIAAWGIKKMLDWTLFKKEKKSKWDAIIKNLENSYYSLKKAFYHGLRQVLR